MIINIYIRHLIIIFKRKNVHFIVPKKHLGKKFPQICSLKKLGSSVVSGKPNSARDYKLLYSSLLINQDDFKRKNVHFSAQESPGEKIPTDLQLEKAKLLCCFRQAKQ